MTSVNSFVIVIRLFVSLFLQRLFAQYLGESGIAKIGQLRNLLNILSSFSSLGIYNGVIKYTSEFKDDNLKLHKLFSTSFLLVGISSSILFCILFFLSETISEYLFTTKDFSYLLKLLAFFIPFIGLQKVFYGIINGFSAYKKIAKIDLTAYLLTAIFTIYFLLRHNITGVFVAISINPIVQLLVLLILLVRFLRKYVDFSKLSIEKSFLKSLMTFSLMSFCSSILLNYVELEIRSTLINKISENDAGIWTAMVNISRNYMVFSGALFSMYVLPKFSGIHSQIEFRKEVIYIYKTILPIFGVGMLMVYFFRELIVSLIYPDFEGLTSLFKWQLLGDFVRLASMVLAHQFLAKKLIGSFIFTEILSLALFYGFSVYFISIYGVSGAVIANFVRYVIYAIVVYILIKRYFNKKKV